MPRLSNCFTTGEAYPTSLRYRDGFVERSRAMAQPTRDGKHDLSSGGVISDAFRFVFLKNVHADVNALGADVDHWPCDQLADVVLRLVAEGAPQHRLCRALLTPLSSPEPLHGVPAERSA